MKKILAIIPARGGSKRILNKNIKLFLGQPLISYSILQAKESKYVDRLVVSTDDDKIASISKKNGVEVIIRPEDLAKDESPMILTIQHTLDFLNKLEGYMPDIVVLLQPTSPLRKSQDIDDCIEKLLKLNADSAETFCEVKDHPELMFRMINNKLKPFNPLALEKRSQEFEKLYVENGAVYVITRETLNKNTLYGNKHIPIIMEWYNSIDIDDDVDFKIAEKLFEGV